MLRLCFLLLAIPCSLAAQAQYVYTIKADSVKLTNNCDSTELVLMNHTQGVNGFLYNYGNGRTRFQRGLLNLGGNNYLIGGDTLKAFGSVLLVPDIPSLQADTTQAVNVVVVADTLRGGIFVYQSTAALPDSGIVFPATGRGSGYWIRTGANNTPANVEWYGAIPNVTADADGNYHAFQSCMNHNRAVYIPSGNWYCDSTLHITNGQNIGGEKAILTGTTEGTMLTMVDTMTAMSCDLTGDVNAFTYIHDLTLNCSASGGTSNYGLVITRSFFDVERVRVQNFGNDGIHISGNSSLIVQGSLNLVYCYANGGNGFSIINAYNVTFTQCEAQSNLATGYYMGGYHLVTTNCAASANYKYAFDDEGSSDMYQNPYVDAGLGDTIMLNGDQGVFQSGNDIGAFFVIAGSGLSNGWAVNKGSTRLITSTLVDQVGTGLNFDTTILESGASLGHISYVAQGSGLGGGGTFPLDEDIMNGVVTAQGGFIVNRTGPTPGLNNPYGKIYLQNTGVSGPDLYSDNWNMIIGEPLSPVCSLGSYGGSSFGTGGYAFLGVAGDTGTSDLTGDLCIYNRTANAFHQVSAGLELNTAIDSNSLHRYLIDHGARISVDTVSGQCNFLTFGSTQGETMVIPWQPFGGNFNFENQDGSTNLFLNTFNKSAYAGTLKLGPSSTPSEGDSLLVWESSDSSVRKIAAGVAVNNLVTITANYTAGTSYPRTIIICNTSAATITLPDPTAASSQNKYYFIRVQTSGQTATVATAAGSIETSLGSFASTAAVTGIPNQGWISNGTNWVLAAN